MYDLRTKNGHNMFDMASMLQKSIRRGNFDMAGYAVNELYWNYSNYMWKRLLVISAEDCYGILTKEIIGLKLADDTINKGRKGDEKDPICAAKAVTLMCQARKNRDACYVACNYICVDRQLELDEIESASLDYPVMNESDIPDWVFDVHTLKGRREGKTDLDMTISEQEALNPLQTSFFDDADWKPYYLQNRKSFPSPKEWKTIEEFIHMKQRENKDKVLNLIIENKKDEALKLFFESKIGTDEENKKAERAYEVLHSKKVLGIEKTNYDDEIDNGIQVIQCVCS